MYYESAHGRAARIRAKRQAKHKRAWAIYRSRLKEPEKAPPPPTRLIVGRDRTPLFLTLPFLLLLLAPGMGCMSLWLTVGRFSHWRYADHQPGLAWGFEGKAWDRIIIKD
jgi:hypothetical protein